MKHNKLFLGLLSAGITASAIPLVGLTSCNKNPSTPVVDFDVDDTLVTRQNDGYIETAESTTGACYLKGFCLTKGTSLSDLTVEVVNLQGTNATVHAEIEKSEYFDNYFNINVYFASKDYLITQYATFDIKISDKSGSRKYTGFEVYSFTSTMMLSRQFNSEQNIGTLTTSDTFEYTMCGDIIARDDTQVLTGDLLNKFSATITTTKGVPVTTIEPSIIVNDEQTKFQVHFKFSSFQKQPDNTYLLVFSNSEYPNWHSSSTITFKFYRSLDQIFELNKDETASTATITNCFYTDENLTIPEKITTGGKTYDIVGLSNKMPLFVQSPIKTIAFGDNIAKADTYSIAMGCPNLTKVTFGKNFKISNDTNPFYNCPSLQEIVIDSANPYISSLDSNCIAFNTNTVAEPKFTYLLAASNSTTTIPSGITTIGAESFSYRNITSITIPKEVTEIGIGAFNDCKNLTTVTFDADSPITTLYDRTFVACQSLKSITLPNQLLEIGYACFSNCISLETITIPQTVKYIKKLAFSSCLKLKSITLPENLISLGEHCFGGCLTLENVSTIPASTIIIGENPFASCPLTDIVVDRDNPIYWSYDGTKECHCLCYFFDDNNVVVTGLPNTILPDKWAVIGPSAFSSSTITEIDLSKVIRIKERGFYNCLTLSKVTFPNDNIEIEANAFYGCVALEEVKIPKVIELESRAFYNCINLKKIEFGSESFIKSIPSYCFANCTALEQINIPESVARIEIGAFYNCNNLTTITIPDNVGTILGSCFGNCLSLKKVVISENSKLNTIKVAAFALCVALESITIPKYVSQIDANAFSGDTSLANAYFKDPNNWTSGSTAVDPEILKDSAQAAFLLKIGSVLKHKV